MRSLTCVLTCVGLTYVPLPTYAQTCQYIGQQMYCSNGLQGSQVGPFTYYNNGQTRQQIGNFDYYSQPITPAPVYVPPPITYPAYQQPAPIQPWNTRR